MPWDNFLYGPDDHIGSRGLTPGELDVLQDERDLLGEKWYAQNDREDREDRERFHEIQESYRD